MIDCLIYKHPIQVDLCVSCSVSIDFDDGVFVLCCCVLLCTMLSAVRGVGVGVGALSLPAVELDITWVSPINLHTSYANHCRHHQISVATINFVEAFQFCIVIKIFTAGTTLVT